MYNNLVSIITPSYKSVKFIKETIDSVLVQTYTNWEMIIVDDCSPDNSNEIIENYILKDSRIKFIKLEKNSGPAVARNRAIEEACGRYIAFLDADDLWMPQKLEKQIAFMNKQKCALSYTSYYVISEENKDLGLFTTKKQISYSDLLKTNSIGCLTAIYDTDILGKVLMPNIIKKQDYALWLKILKQIDYAKGIVEPLAYYRIVENSVSSNKMVGIKYIWKIFREVEKLNIFQSMYYFSYYVYYGIKKYK